MFMMAGTSTLLQLRVPDNLRGRVMSFHTTVFLGAFPFGGLVAGQLADRYGEPPVLFGAGLLVACGGILRLLHAWPGRHGCLSPACKKLGCTFLPLRRALRDAHEATNASGLFAVLRPWRRIS